MEGDLPVENRALQPSGTNQPNRLDHLLNGLLAVVLLTELAVLFCNIALRFFTGQSWVWVQELADIALAVLTFLGGAVAYRRGQHMAVHVVVERASAGAREALTALTDWLILLAALIAGSLSVPVFRDYWNQHTPILQLRQSWLGVPLFVGCVLLIYFAVDRLRRQSRRAVLATGAGVLAAVLVLVTVHGVLGQLPTGPALGLTFLLFLTLLLAGVPIGFVLILVSSVYLFMADAAPMTSVPLSLQGATSSFVLLAVPLFILAGNIMTEGGLSAPLAESLRSIFGHIRGGLLQVVVVTMYIFSGISGAKVADVAAVGSTMKDMLREGGYDPAETTAVLAASAVMGETVPPSVAMLVLGSISSLSVGALFMAGIVPAAVMALFLMVLAYVRTRSAGMQPGVRPPIGEVARKIVKALPAMIVPVILIFGILEGIATPTEVSSFAVVYALVVSLFYRQFTRETFWKVMADTAGMAGMILFIISTGSLFSLALTMANLPGRIADLLTTLGGSTGLFMLASIVTLVLMGSLLEGLPALLIFGPLLLPIAQRLGINGLHYGIVLIFAMGLGAFAPPIGVGMYVACSVCGTTMEAATRKMLPYIAVLLIGLVVITFVPWLTLVVPRALHMAM